MNKVLIVEDSKFVAKVVKRTVEKSLGLEVEVAGTLAEAQVLLARDADRFFIAVVDLNLPDARNGEAVEEVKRYGIAPIVFTGKLDGETRSAILERGVVDYVFKSNQNEMGYLIRLIDRIRRNQFIKILIVDDSLTARMVLKNLLEIHRFQVIEAGSPARALDCLREHPDIRLATLDYHMPGMNGAELVTEIRTFRGREELAIIGISSQGAGQLSALLLKAGANDFLSKPFVNEEFYCRVMQNLEVIERNLELAEANRKITSLNRKLRKENVRLSTELEVTKRLQQMILPTEEELEAVEHLDIAGFMEPADEVGGDYYDVLQAGDRIKIGMGDVTGHGLESGVVMLMTQTAVRTLLNAGVTDPVHYMDALNRTICDNVRRMKADKSLTLCLLDYQPGRVTLSGQHEEMITVRGDGRVELVDTMDLGFPIGLDDDIREFVNASTVKLEAGDGVVLYTDGITEAENPDGEQYGLERMCAVIQRNWSQPAAVVKQAVIDDLHGYIDGHHIYDDISLLVLKQR
ncbi:MAG: SpoIIE family protein phosphatase [Acidobacteriota bacterium]|nr:SpoIIE family protein phosphatase [Acidobacteriota bacterium]